MCTRFTTIRVNATDAPSDAAFGAAGVGLAPNGSPDGTRSTARDRHAGKIAVEPAELTVGGPANEPRLSVLTLAVEAQSSRGDSRDVHR
jgi:hypothetical protein